MSKNLLWLRVQQAPGVQKCWGLDIFQIHQIYCACIKHLCNICSLRLDGSWMNKWSGYLFGIPWNSERISQGTLSCTDTWKREMYPGSFPQDIIWRYLQGMEAFFPSSHISGCLALPIICCKVVVRKDEWLDHPKGKKPQPINLQLSGQPWV